MKTDSKKIRVLVALALGVMGLVVLVYIGVGYKSERDALAVELGQAHHRNKLLEEKYKEQKAETARFQRGNLLLDGQVRKAKSDLEQLKEENLGLQKRIAETEGVIQQKLSACDADREKMVVLFEKMKTAHEDLKTQIREARTQVKTSENEVKRMTGEIASLNAELKRTLQMRDRYYGHNVALSDIARTLAGRIEKKELGASILVKEPLVQFERVELEQLLQEYLDKIDDQRIFHETRVQAASPS